MIETYRPILRQNKSQSKKIGIWVTQPKKDIKSLNRSDFAFLTDRPSVSKKRYVPITLSATVTNSPTPFVFNDILTYTAVYKHAFNYIPEMFVFVTTAATRQGGSFDAGNAYINVPSTWQSGDDVIGGQHYEVFNAEADDQNVYVTVQRYTIAPGIGQYNVAGTYKFDILLLMEEAK